MPNIQSASDANHRCYFVIAIVPDAAKEIIVNVS